MFSTHSVRALATVAVVTGMLAVAGPANAIAGVVTDNKDPDKLHRAVATASSGAITAADFNYHEWAPIAGGGKAPAESFMDYTDDTLFD